MKTSPRFSPRPDPTGATCGKIAIVLTLTFFASLTAPAHPPESHRKRGDTNEPVRIAQRAEAGPVVTEADRQQAYFAFEFLSELAERCPMTLQQAILRQLIDEHRLATQTPDAPPLDKLRQSRQSLHAKLRDALTGLDATWGSDGPSWQTPPASVAVARGMSRFVIIDLRNTTDNALTITAACEGAGRTGRPMTILPDRTQPLLVELFPGQTQATVNLKTEQESQTLTIPITTVEGAKLRGRIIDGDTGRPTPGRVWVECGDGQLRRGGPFAANRSFLEKPILEIVAPRMAAVPFFYADGSFEIDVPPGPTTVTLGRGFEHAPSVETIDLKPGESHEITLSSRRLIDAKQEGWVSGDTHIHWVTNAWNVDLPLTDLAMVQRAEDLRVVNNLTLLHRTDRDAFVKPSQGPIGPIAAHSDREYHIEMAEEYRNQNLYGHLCFLDLQWLVLPVGTGPQIAGEDSLDYPINKTAIIEARGQGGISIEAHGIGANHELPLNAIHGLTDSVDQIDPEDYYRLLDCGFQLPLTNGSDHPARVAGCARAYVRVDGEFDYEKWIDGIRKGQTFTTSGPLLFLTVDGEGPGSVIRSPAATVRPESDLSLKPHVAKLRAVSRYPLGRVQIIANGKVLAERQTDERELTLECDIPANESQWVVARCSRNDQWNAIWHPDVAHTSAIYLLHQGRPVFREAAAREWIDRMRWHAREILLKGRFANIAQRQEATAYVDESIRRYERLIATQASPRRAEDIATTRDEVAVTRDRLLMQVPFVSHLGHDPAVVQRISAAEDLIDVRAATEAMTLLKVHINPESRVKLAIVTPPETLVRYRTRRFLVEIHNEARIEAPLRIVATDRAANSTDAAPWCWARLVDNLLSSSSLTGAEHEWKLIELRCDAIGHREIHLEADAGQGTQDLGFRAAVDLLIRSVPRSENRTLLPPVNP